MTIVHEEEEKKSTFIPSPSPYPPPPSSSYIDYVKRENERNGSVDEGSDTENGENEDQEAVVVDNFVDLKSNITNNDITRTPEATSSYHHNNNNNNNNSIDTSNKKKNNSHGIRNAGYRSSLVTRRTDRRLSELFANVNQTPPSMPVSPHFSQTFEFGPIPPKSTSTNIVSNIGSAATSSSSSTDTYDQRLKNLRDENQIQILELQKLPSSPKLHPIFLTFDDDNLEDRFAKDCYFGENGLYCWRVILVFLFGALLYGPFVFLQDSQISIYPTIHKYLQLLVASLYAMASLLIYMQCRKHYSRDKQKNENKNSRNHPDSECVQYVEYTILVVVSLAFSVNMLLQHHLYNYDPTLQIGAYLHIWASLTLIRPRFTLVLILCGQAIASWLFFALQYDQWGIMVSRKRFGLHFCGLIFLISYILAEMYAVERLMRMSFLSTRKEAIEQRLLEAEKKKSQTLLHNILPRILIPDLKRKKIATNCNNNISNSSSSTSNGSSYINPSLSLEKIVPVVRNCNPASVLLSDIQNFTEFSSTRSAEDVLLILNIHFSYFDVVCKKLRVEKVKTIGDAFMAVGGLGARTKHQSAECLYKLITMGCGFLRIIDLLNRKYNWEFHVRIGVSYGQVIATVLGQEYLTFDCFGSAVNEARLMEKNATPDSILATEQVFAIAKDKFAFSSVENSNLSRPAYALITEDTHDTGERITDLILDDRLHDLLNNIIEEQSKFAAESIIVRHAELNEKTASPTSPHSTTVPRARATSPKGQANNYNKKMPSIGYFSQSPLFTSEYMKLTSDQSEDSPSVPKASFLTPEVTNNTTPLSTFGQRSRERLNRLLKFRDHDEERRYVHNNYKNWRTRMSTYLLSQLIVDVLFACVPFVLKRYDVTDNTAMKVHYLSTIVHAICLYCVSFTKTYSKKYGYGIAISVISLAFSLFSCFAFALDQFTRREILPACITTLMHTLAIPPNLSFTHKLLLVLTVLLVSDAFASILLKGSANRSNIIAYIQAAAFCGLVSNYLKEWAIRNVALKKTLKEDSKTSLQLEKQMNDKLILSVLLESTLERIKQGEINIFDNIRDCSVCFIKIDGMEELIARYSNDDSSSNSGNSGTASARLERVFAFLDLMMQMFDGSLANYFCEKIKSINSTYMAVCGISFDVPNHTEHLLLFALDLSEQLHQLCESPSGREILGIDQKLRLKIGLHSGPVSGGVLGYHRFLYDIFGDTVNCASRACSTSEHYDEVQMAEEVFHRVKPVLTCYHLAYEHRGLVAVKGKGLLDMFYVRRQPHVT